MQLLVFGASGHGKVVADAALSSNWEVVGFGDDRPDLRGQLLLGCEVLCTGVEECVVFSQREGAEVLVAIGDNRIRRQVYRRFLRHGVHMATVVHRGAIIGRSVRIGAGTVIMGGVVVNPDTVVGENCILNTSATLDHDNEFGSHAHLSPGAHLGGAVRVGEGVHIGIGAAVRNNIEIGPWSVIGAGSTVVSDIPGCIVAFGCPAKPKWEFED